MPDFAEKLAYERARMARLLRPEAAESIDREIAALRSSDALGNIRQVGERAPSFDLIDVVGRQAHSEELLRQGPLVVSFFRGTWCPYCMLELFEFSRCYATIRGLGADFVAITPQSAETSEMFYSEHPMAFRVLTDTGGHTADAFGVSYTVASYMHSVYRSAFGLNLPFIHKDHRWRLPIPSRFVIDRNGTIVYARNDPDFRNALEPTEILTVLEGLRAS